MGIAEQETHFGEYEYKDTKGKKHGNLRLMGKDLATDVGTITHKNIGKISIYGSDHSWGVTQINWNKNFEGDVEPNPTLRRQAAKFGITSYKDYQYNPEKAAILTMILLNNKRIIAESREWQERLAENNAQIDNNTNYTTKQKEEKKITTTDIIALLWNGMSGIPQRFDNPYKYVTIDDNNSGMVTRNGNKIKDGISYARNVRAYRNKFFSVDRLEGSHENNGKIGTVLFMPTAFAGNQKATKSDFEILERALGTKAGIDNAKKDAMLAALRSGYFSFGYGLTEEEAESITANDIDIILEKVDKVKDFVQANNSPKERRNFAKLIQDEFRAEYLKSRQIIVNISDVNRNTVIRAFRYQGDVDNRLSENRNVRITAAHIGSRVQGQAMNAVRSADAAETSGVRYGFRVERDKGVNPYDENARLV